MASLTPAEATALNHCWSFWARDNQLKPATDWVTWLILAGRGFGKTRVGAETVREWARSYRLVNLIGATADDARDIMIEGESGILAVCPKHERPVYKKSDRQLLWPSGCKSLIFTADEPDRLRGKQHEKLWADELAAWRYEEAWDQALMGLRLGDDPQSVVTTTPRPTKIIRELMKDPETHVTRGSTYDNRANLASTFFDRIIKKYEGTRLGRQELQAEVLDDNPNALWQRAWIDRDRLKPEQVPQLHRIAVAIDPSVHDGTKTKKESAKPQATDRAEAGIVGGGIATINGVDHGYVLDDKSTFGSPAEWAQVAVDLFRSRRSDRIVAEVNNGGHMVEMTIRAIDRKVPYTAVHASRGKFTRAEPVSALYEQRRVHHVGSFPVLEDEMCDWEPGMPSPNRMDALVWLLTYLMLTSKDKRGFGVD